MKLFVQVALFALLSYHLVEGDCDSNLGNDLIDGLLDMVLKIKLSENCSHPNTSEIPAFSASMTNAKVLGATEILRFDKVWTNNGNYYDPNTGIFKAHLKGVYQFSFTVMSSRGKNLRVYLWQNGNRLVGVYPGIGYNEGTANIAINLEKGDKVYVKCGGSGHGFIHTANGYWYSMFSGYLIHATK
uniref:Putative C1q domain containing protein MgC1q82 n=1 Tax=Mytilus galloprovincialis TaxID=29158 RepID=F0V4B9_MYTGA|nr:putative C1q domain containing protein MgC1q82 [Mytilus galloprovincialis]